MARSMTGFGRGTASDGGVQVTVELKTVNHKHLSIHMSNSRSYPELETLLRSHLQKAFERGSLSVSFSIERPGSKQGVIELDVALARSYHEAFLRLEREIEPLQSMVKLEQIAALPGVLVLREPELDSALLQELLQEALHAAIAAAQDLRAREGQTLTSELKDRLNMLRQQVGQVQGLTEQTVQHYRQKLRERIAALLVDTDVTLLQERLEMEIALIADRSDVTEEVERLKSHFEQFERMLSKDSSVGRQLDFLCQEMSRELNTIGSKSQDARLAQLVVDMRAENERIREQVQNLE